MKRLRTIFRIIVILLAIVLLVYSNGRTNDTSESVAEFKFKMFQKLKTDSLDSKHKVELLVDETTKYVNHTSRVKKGLNYLTLLFTLVVVVEIVFLIVGKASYAQPRN
jgi:uncharacterized membrane protein